ncbi:MAG: NADH-quinone oxidoreductase subunit M, partial [Alphaproteobacteria bacterium]
MDLPILTLLLIIPLIGVALISIIDASSEQGRANIKMSALWASLVNLVVALYLWFAFDNSNGGFQFIERHDLFGDYFAYHLGVDGIAVMLIVLTAFLMPICILASWEAIDKRIKEYMIAFLVMETLMIGVFCALDIFLFYIFFEGGLIPMFLIIGVWGGERRVYAAFKFFLYTLLGSVLMLLAMIYMVGAAGTTDMVAMMDHAFAPDIQTWLWLGFFASFAVKMPMWPVHTWLPDAHVEAP